MQKLFLFLSILFLLTSCGGDDDICLNSDSTPSLKLKFRNNIDQQVRLDSLYVDVDYGNNTYKNILTRANADSVMIPLRIDDSPYTDVRIRLRKRGAVSSIRISYDKKSIYVSPACGFKINFENLKADLLQSDPVHSILSNHTSLTDESKVNFYLRF